MQILLDSYGMIPKVPKNLSAHYFKKHYGDYKENHMKNINSAFTRLSESEKAQLQIELDDAIAKFEIANKKFLEQLPKQRNVDLEYFYSKKNRPRKFKSISKTADTEIESDSDSITNLDGLSKDEAINIDFDDLDKRVVNAKKQEKFDQLIRDDLEFSENAFSCYVLTDLKNREKMNKDESLAFLRKISQKWLKLDQSIKEDYENMHKKQKKGLKKELKKLSKDGSDVELDIDEVKQYFKQNSRIIEVHLANDTTEDLVISNKKQAALLDQDITCVEKKPKAVNENGKRKSEQETMSQKKVLKKDS